MARRYADLFTGDQNDFALPTRPVTPDSGRFGSRLRYGYSHVRVETTNYTNGDEVRIARFHSSDRIIRLYLTVNTATNLGVINVGYYLSGVNGDGAVVHSSHMGSVVVSGALTNDIRYELTENYKHHQLGERLWEQTPSGGGPGSAMYTVDPNLSLDLVMTLGSTPSGTIRMRFECYFVTND